MGVCRIYDENFLSQGSGFLHAFFRRFVIGDDNIQGIQRNAVADGADVPFGVVQQQDTAAGDGGQGPLGGGHGLGMFKGSARYLKGTAGEKGQIHLIFLEGFGILQQQRAVAVMEKAAGQQHLYLFFGGESQGSGQAGGDCGQGQPIWELFHHLLNGGAGIQTDAAHGL